MKKSPLRSIWLICLGFFGWVEKLAEISSFPSFENRDEIFTLSIPHEGTDRISEITLYSCERTYMLDLTCNVEDEFLDGDVIDWVCDYLGECRKFNLELCV